MADVCRPCVADGKVADPHAALEATVSAVSTFLVRADAARDRRADAVGPALLRALREIWHDAGKDAIRDLEEACERLLFPVPEASSASSGKGSGKGSSKGREGRGGGRQGRSSSSSWYDGGGGKGGDQRDYYQPRRTYESLQPWRDQWEMHHPQEVGPPISYSIARPSQAVAPPTAAREDRCHYCQGEHLSQRCFTKFPHLRHNTRG